MLRRVGTSSGHAVFPADFPGLPGIRWAFSDRHGGVSSAPYDSMNLGTHVADDLDCVVGNRALLAQAAGLAPDALQFMSQVHGRAVVVVEDWLGPGEVPEADALVTTRSGLGLVVIVADCVPVLLAARDDIGRPVIAAVHAGRAGVELGVVPAALDAIRGFGPQPSQIRAVVGPCICGPCYEVPEELADRVAAAAPATRARSRTGTPALDLRAGVEAALRACGVTSITHDDACTLESPDLFSHRGAVPTGRFAGIVWAEPT